MPATTANVAPATSPYHTAANPIHDICSQVQDLQGVLEAKMEEMGTRMEAKVDEAIQEAIGEMVELLAEPTGNGSSICVNHLSARRVKMALSKGKKFLWILRYFRCTVILIYDFRMAVGRWFPSLFRPNVNAGMLFIYHPEACRPKVSQSYEEKMSGLCQQGKPTSLYANVKNQKLASEQITLINWNILI